MAESFYSSRKASYQYRKTGYHKFRIRQYRLGLDESIERFIDTYRTGNEIILLIPGGGGSRLSMSSSPFSIGMKEDVPYEMIWPDLGVALSKEAQKFALCEDGTDYNGHVIRPEGIIEFPRNIYRNALNSFTDGYRQWHALTFTYDWRRTLTETALNFLYFLRTLQKRVKERLSYNVAGNVTIVGHSQGGLVSKILLARLINRGMGKRDIESRLFKRLITVGAPFYGTCDLLKIMMHGDDLLNSVFGPTSVTSILSQFPSLYAVFPSGVDIWRRDGEEIGLKEYPVRDYMSKEPVDPFNPDSFHSRYPSWISSQHLKWAQHENRLLSEPLENDVEHIVFNIRSGMSMMPTSYCWKVNCGQGLDRLRKELVSFRTGRGDGVVPHWSSALPQLHKIGHVYDCKEKSSHQNLLNNQEVVNEVVSLVTSGSFSKV